MRAILDVEPPAGLRGRVLRRIESRDGGAASAFMRKAAWFALPLAVAAALILVLRTPSPVVMNPTRPVAIARVETPQPTPSAPALVSPPAQVSSVRPAPQLRRSDRSVAATLYAPAQDITATIEPLETITPIQVTPIAQRSVATEDIAVRPLNPITDVQIAPLTPPERRD